MRLKSSPAGSILIWTIAMGMIMTSVFLFMALQLNRNSTLNRDALDFLQQKAYLKGYANYLKQLDTAEWETLKENGVDYDGITGTLTNHTQALKGYLDEGQSLALPLNGTLMVEWNECLQGIIKEEGVLETTPPLNLQPPKCANNSAAKYDHWGMVSGESETLTLTSTGEPTHYHITEGIANTGFDGNEWRLELETRLKNGRTLRLKESW